MKLAQRLAALARIDMVTLDTEAKKVYSERRQQITKEDRMFNKVRLKEAVTEYKKCFVQKWWPDEKYKWEMVKCFQVNWNVNADDFAAMLTKSLAKAAIRWWQRNF